MLRLHQEGRDLHAQVRRALRRVERTAGLSEADLRAIEKEIETREPKHDTWEKHLWRVDIEHAVAEPGDLDAFATAGLEHLLSIVDPVWLRAEARKPYRLGTGFLQHPLHIVNGVCVGTAPATEGPQRFAAMLLITEDHLEHCWSLDFFSAASFVPDIAALGTSLHEIRDLGPEAIRKLESLPRMTADQVTATIYELLVGTACVRKGRAVRMVPEDRSRKVPDFELRDLGPVRGAIECKRRLGLTAYELEEAKCVERLYQSVRAELRQDDAHGSIEVGFNTPVVSVSLEDFRTSVLGTVRHPDQQQTAAFGFLVFRPLPQLRSVMRTRLYSPNYLQEAFGWEPLQDEWDGLLCEVDPLPNIQVELAARPLCLKWKSEAPEALIKKSRGVTAMLANAIRQIPDGDIGFPYIAYPEGARPALADARTKHILELAAGFYHRWSVRVPAFVITRLYPRPLGSGVPDLIENVLPGAQKGEEFWFESLPTLIYTDR